ncbi:hypothetical protein C5167_027208 [Papaver somniferum]|nr:hypothetical protein C5167_027208 [Papaver somniferum]
MLTVTECFDETRVKKRKVEELVLSIESENPFIFPLSFFTCDSLVVLDLKYNSILCLPNTISFPRIKILRLTNIEFVNENLTGELFSNCPILEGLCLFDCDFVDDFKVLCITSGTLKHLSIINCCLFHQTLKVFTPNLLTIKYAAELPADFVLGRFLSLVEADIQISNNRAQPRLYAPIIKLYQRLFNVKLLKTSGSSFQGVHNDDQQDYDWTVISLPWYSLPNLKTVTIMISECLLEDYKEQMQIASELLKFPRYSSSCALGFMTPE